MVIKNKFCRLLMMIGNFALVPIMGPIMLIRSMVIGLTNGCTIRVILKLFIAGIMVGFQNNAEFLKTGDLSVF